ncbi:hypothetical protein D9M69_577390 [compost metagenome]
MHAKLLASLAEERTERRAFRRDTTLQSAFAHAEFATHTGDLRTATRHHPLDHGLDLLNQGAFRLQFAHRLRQRGGQHLQKLGVVTDEWTVKIGRCQNEPVLCCAETDRTVEVGAVQIRDGAGPLELNRDWGKILTRSAPSQLNQHCKAGVDRETRFRLSARRPFDRD